MASIQPNFNPALKPAQIQAERLKGLPDKTAYNEFADATLQGDRFLNNASDEARSLAKMTRTIARSIPDADTKFKLYQAAFESAVSGAVCSSPGGPAAVMAKIVLDLLPGVDPRVQTSVASQTLDTIVTNSPVGEARDHAEFAQNAGTRAYHSSKEASQAIMVSGLGVIADLGAPSAPDPTSSGLDPNLEKAQASFLKAYQALDCPTTPGFFDSPHQMKEKFVAILTRDQETGTVTEAVGRVRPQGESLKTSLFTLEKGGRVYNSNDVIGLAVSPYALSSPTPDSFKNSLKSLKAEKETCNAWIQPKEAQGLDCYPGGRFNGLDLEGRNVSVLMWTNEERTATKEFSGTVTDTNWRTNALFKLDGRGPELNTNDLVAVAFHDGRYTPRGAYQGPPSD